MEENLQCAYKVLNGINVIIYLGIYCTIDNKSSDSLLTRLFAATNNKTNHLNQSDRMECNINFPHSTVIFKEYFETIPLKFCNIAKIFIKLLERFIKSCRNLAMSVQNIIIGILLRY